MATHSSSYWPHLRGWPPLRWAQAGVLPLLSVQGGTRRPGCAGLSDPSHGLSLPTGVLSRAPLSAQMTREGQSNQQARFSPKREFWSNHFPRKGFSSLGLPMRDLHPAPPCAGLGCVCPEQACGVGLGTGSRLAGAMCPLVKSSQRCRMTAVVTAVRAQLCGKGFTYARGGFHCPCLRERTLSRGRRRLGTHPDSQSWARSPAYLFRTTVRGTGRVDLSLEKRSLVLNPLLDLLDVSC